MIHIAYNKLNTYFQRLEVNYIRNNDFKINCKLLYLFLHKFNVNVHLVCTRVLFIDNNESRGYKISTSMKNTFFNQIKNVRPRKG